MGGGRGPAAVASPAPLGGVVQAAPAGIFTAFAGAYDYLLTGTRDGGADNAFVALDPADGSELAASLRQPAPTPTGWA